MGYTRYWERTNKPYDEEFINQVQQIINRCTSLGISIKDGFGEGNPEISMNKIWINGNAEFNLDHETFAIINTTSEHFQVGTDFCKTARKPYDFAVREILKIAEESGIVSNVSADGDNNVIISDEDYLIQEIPRWIYWSGFQHNNEISNNILQELYTLCIDSNIEQNEKLLQCKNLCEQNEILKQIYLDYIKKYNINEK